MAAQVFVEGHEKLMPCAPSEPDAVEMDWTQVPSDQLLEPPVMLSDFFAVIKDIRRSVSDAEAQRMASWTRATA